MQIQRAVDWQQTEPKLRLVLFNSGYNPDLKRMLDNINAMVSDLSKAEVEARRTHSDKYIKVQLDKVNAAIKHLEQFFLIAQLMK